MAELGKRRSFWLEVTLLGLAGVALVGAPWACVEGLPHQVAEVLPKLGEAFIIAVVLSIIVDRAAKRDLLAEFAEDVSGHIIGRLVPNELRDLICQYLSNPLVRKSWTIDYAFEELPDHEDFVRVTAFAQHEMENRSRVKLQYEHVYQIAEAPQQAPEPTRILSFGLACPDQAQSFLEVAPGGRIKIQNGSWIARESIWIPPAGHGPYVFSAKSVECSRTNDHEAFTARYPVMTTKVTVKYPVERMEVQLTVSSDDTGKPVPPEPGPDGGTWTISTPLLPGQSFTLSWKAKGLQVDKKVSS